MNSKKIMLMIWTHNSFDFCMYATDTIRKTYMVKKNQQLMEKVRYVLQLLYIFYWLTILN